MLVVVLLIELGWALAVGISVFFGRTLILQLAIPGVVALVCRLTGRCRTVGRIADTVLVWTVVAVVGTPLTYLAARADFPLQDATFLAFDHALGFDGISWAATVNTQPWLHYLLSAAYGSLGMQILFCCALFPLTDEMWRFRELFWLAWIGLLVTCAISAFLPAAGITARYATADPVWREHLFVLRSVRPIVADIGAMHGIVFFPSYHAALAVAFAYVHRRAGVLTIFMVALNALMLLSALSEGDHYLVDVIAGVAMMASLILALRYSGLARERRTAR